MAALITRGAVADVNAVRELPRLPDTADEINALAAAQGAQRPERFQPLHREGLHDCNMTANMQRFDRQAGWADPNASSLVIAFMPTITQLGSAHRGDGPPGMELHQL